MFERHICTLPARSAAAMLAHLEEARPWCQLLKSYSFLLCRGC